MTSTLVQNNHIHKKNKQEVLLVDGSGGPEIGNSSFFYKIMEGIFIPNEILKLKDINITEKVVLSIYKYYTEQGKYKCCSLSKPQIADELGISVDYVKDIKKHLKELGYIRTDGGIRVIYLGVQGGDITPSDEIQGGDITPTSGGYNTQGGGYNTHQVGDITPSEWGIYPPHKKEKKDKKEIKKEKKVMTNFDLLLDRFSSDYKTPERIDYIKDKYEERINNTDIVDIESWFINIRNELNTIYPIEYKAEKKKPISNTIDVL